MRKSHTHSTGKCVAIDSGNSRDGKSQKLDEERIEEPWPEPGCRSGESEVETVRVESVRIAGAICDERGVCRWRVSR